MSNLSGLRRHPAVTAVAGAGALAVGVTVSACRAATRVPVVGARIDDGVTALSRRGEAVLARGVEPVRSLAIALVVQIVEQVLDELDLTALVVRRVDVDAIARQVDIDAIIDRIDLIGLADQIIDGVDLPRIIRDSTTSVTADVVTDVRTQGERADDAVSGLIDRMLGRTRDDHP